MSGIIVYNESKMHLTPKEFINDTLEHKKIAEIASYENIKNTKLFIAFQMLAFNIGEEPSSFEKKELEQLILSEFKRLSWNELYYAMRLERYGKLDPSTSSYGRFDVMFVGQVLNKYKKWKIEQRKIHNLPIGKSNLKIEVSEDEKKALIFNGVMDCYDHYIETYFIQDGKTYVYDVLFDIDLLPKDNETKIQAYAEAKLVIKNNMSKAKGISIKDRDEYKYIKTQLELKKSDLVVREAKHILIGRYFRKTKRDELEKILKKRL